MTFQEYQAILKTIRPFIPSDRLRGQIVGMTVDVEAGILSASRNEGGILYPVDETFSSKSLVLTLDYIDRLLKLQAPTWSGLKVNGTLCTVQVGHVRMSFSVVEKTDYFVPNLTERPSTPVPQEFINQIASMAPFMNTDDRKLNMYGMYASEDALYTCDNVRAVKKLCVIPEGLKNTFFPFFCIQTILKNRNIDEAVALPGHIAFASPSYVQYFSLFNTKFPPIETVFDRLDQTDGVDVSSLIEVEEIKQLLSISFSDQISSNVEVKIEGSKMDLNLQSERGSGDQIQLVDCPIANPVEGQHRFVVDVNQFLEGLQTYPNFRITKDAIVMRNPERTVTYVVMRKVGL